MEQAVKKSGRNNGHTLAAVIVFLLLVTLLWRGSLSQQGSYFRVEKACLVQQANRDGCMHSLAWALTLLETGLPPESPYSCLMASPVDANEIFVATFTQLAGVNYTVSVRLATPDDASLPPAPEAFEPDESKPEKPEKPKKPKEPQGPKPKKPKKPKEPQGPKPKKDNQPNPPEQSQRDKKK